MNMLDRLMTRQENATSAPADPLSFRGRRWVFPKANHDDFRSLVAAGHSRAMSGVLAARGLNAATAPTFLDADVDALAPAPGFILDLDKAIDRIAQAVAFGQKIAIWGDYDVDGATSSAIMARTLRAGGAEVTIKIPDRIKEGYGPNSAGLLQLKADGHDLVIIVDSGTTAFEPLKAAADAGLDCIVIDHHAAEETLPQAIAVVNPNRVDQHPGYGQMCAAGVSWLAARGIAERLGLGTSFADELLDIVALGTVCDVVPLKGINRAIVRRGLEIMANTTNPGIKALLSWSQVEGDPSPYHCGFLLGPRINAGGRIGESWMGAVLLSSDDANECMALAERLTELNSQRQKIEKAALEEAEAMVQSQLDRPALVVVGEGWHEGVIGIVAGRLKESYDKPVFVFSRIEDKDGKSLAKGSGRSMPDFDMGATVIAARQSGLLDKGGGHAMAAGATIDLSKLDDFRATFEAAVRASKFFESGPTTRIDAEIHPANADVPFIASLDPLEPYGQGNPKPRFMLRAVRVTDINDAMRAKGHFKGTIRRQGAELTALMFRAAGTALGEALFASEGKPIDLVVTLDINEWRDRRTAQALIEDARPAVLTTSPPAA